LYEDKGFSHRTLAALVASKVFYHLGSYQDSLYFALGAGGLFDLTSTSQYVSTIVGTSKSQRQRFANSCKPLDNIVFSLSAAKSIDHYTKLRLLKIAKEKKAHGKLSEDWNFVVTGQPELIPSESVMLTLSGLDSGKKSDVLTRPIDPDEPIDPRLEQIVDRMFQRCFDHGQYKQAMGIALETRRMDIFEKSILLSDDVLGMLSYAYKVHFASYTMNTQILREILLKTESHYVLFARLRKEMGGSGISKIDKESRTIDHLHICSQVIKP
jgi:26S proteasome regulatory subunit N2